MKVASKSILVIAIAAAAQSSLAAQAWPVTPASHRSFFCGAGEDLEDRAMPASYGHKMNAELRARERKGMTTKAAMADLRSVARCAEIAPMGVVPVYLDLAVGDSK